MTAVRSFALWFSGRFARQGGDYAAWQEAQTASDADRIALSRDVGPRWPDAPVPPPASAFRR